MVFTRHFTSGYRISDDREALDMAVIHRFLSLDSCWAQDRPLAVTQRAIANSLCFGIYAPSGIMAGFGRVVTDYATIAHLSDVFVLPEHRGQGLAQALMAAIIDHPDLTTVKRWSLSTNDAHGLYAKFGFAGFVEPWTQMVRIVPYQQQVSQ